MTHKMLAIGEPGKGDTDVLYAIFLYFCNFPVGLKLFSNKNVFKM